MGLRALSVIAAAGAPHHGSHNRHNDETQWSAQRLTRCIRWHASTLHSARFPVLENHAYRSRGCGSPKREIGASPVGLQEWASTVVA